MPEPQTLLIVEDDPFIAMDMETEFSDRGYRVVAVAQTVSAASAILEHSAPDFAILDYNLGDDTSVLIARKLNEADIPFVFVTGRPDAVASDEEAPDAPIYCKPVNFDEIEKTHLAN
ncbi:response regulator [Pararhizobium sp. IMCC21322]|uniref:response regulator n=1 Tax=Pararhizobium sp. IMCC21322 TaxID=3067903 RepID=UPI0027415630|nr:response regulator [Pararhizobium sp. IMCC21322]